MGKVFEPGSQVTNPALDTVAYAGWKLEENRVEFPRVNLGSLVHQSTLFDAHPLLSKIGFSAFDARQEFRLQARLIIEVVRKPVLNLQGLLSWQCPNFPFDFGSAHRCIFCALARFVS